jgi:hypothetical protein
MEEMKTPEVQLQVAGLNLAISQKIGDAIADDVLDPDLAVNYPDPPPDEICDGDEALDEPEDPDATHVDVDDYTPESYDEYLLAEILLPHDGEFKTARVRNRVKDKDGRPVGKRNANPLLDTREYEVEFPDGSVDALQVNLIAENMFSQIDNEGRSYAILQEIVDHRKNGHALTADDGFYTAKNGRRHAKQTTRGWEILVEWKDGTSSWLPMKDIKESNPLELAEYAKANKIVSEPAFAWWVQTVLRRRDRIINKVASRYWKKTHKYGVELPHSVKEALAIDDRTGTQFWRLAIEKEMKNVMAAFEFNDEDKIPIGYKHITCHMVFDIKSDLTRKARLVGGGHQTEVPKESTYSSVVSRDSVRIAFLYAALNDLDILSADVQNAYLNAPTKEKLYTTAGLEFGSNNVNRPVLIVRALYGLRSSGARWREHMASTLRDGGYVSCKADPDVWLRPMTKPNGDTYWEYALCYVDDILIISHKPQEAMDYLSSKYKLKEGSVKEPDSYLGADIKKWNIESSADPTKTRWAMSSDTYVKRAVADVERELMQIDERLATKVTTPIHLGYRPELDTTAELDPKRASYYQGLIGVLRWITELGRIDILVAVAMLSRHSVAPRRGHLEQVFHIFAYLKRYERSTMVFDDNLPHFDETRFVRCDWTEFYPGAKEVEPPNAPELRGKSITMSCYVDADHAGCRATRRSHSGILIFLNRAPILWYSKRQNTVETSTFGSEYVAAKTAVEMIEGLRYKLRMMGIPVAGATNFFCDNESVVKSSVRPESTLKKKHNAIAYHRVREAQAADIIRVAWEPTDSNLADLLTKVLPGPKLRTLIAQILW